MQVVKVLISNPNPDQEESATIILESKRGDMWNRDDSSDLPVKKDETQRVYQLGRNQRLVIETRTEPDLMVSPTQFAAVDRKRQESDTDVDAPKEKAEGTNLNQAEQRMARDAKLNTAPGVESMKSPPSADANKKDDTSKSVGARDSGSVKDNRP